MSEPLRVSNLSGGYGALRVFRAADLTLAPARVLGILGPNGAGKTTLLKTLAGLLRAHDGSIVLDGRDITSLPAHQRARQGLILVPEGRQILATLTVRQNLDLTRAVGRLDDAAHRRRMDEVLALFPRLSERLAQPGGSLSGGEQQMLAIARALLCDPRVLMLDEPTQGLAPIIVSQVQNALMALKGRFPMVIVEQSRTFLASLADETLSMHGGQITAG
jgi:ABC-type branched-subunit amino acid transport system ATPase component